VDFSSRRRGDFNARHRVRRIRRLTGASATRDNLVTQPLVRSLARSLARLLARARLDFRDKAPARSRSKNLLTGVLIVARASHLRTDADKQVTQSEIINYGYFNCRLRAGNVPSVRPSVRPSVLFRERARGAARERATITAARPRARYSIRQSLMIYRRKNWPTIKAAFRGFDLETGAAPARRITQSQSRFLCFSFSRPRARARSLAQ